MRSVLLCSGHNSPIIDVVYSNGLLHSRCQSSSIYSWNVDGQLVSKQKAKMLKRVGQSAAVREPGNGAITPAETAVREFVVVPGFPVFSRVVPLIMPNCQTFAVVLNVIEFLNSFSDYSELPIRQNPHFLTLFMLWKLHVGEGKLPICDEMDLLSSFTLAIAGANYSVTLPISRRAQTMSRYGLTMCASKMDLFAINPTANITSHVAFEFSSLLSAIHSIAASAIGQCFVETRGDGGLSVVSAMCQTRTSMALSQAVPPSLFAFANWLLVPNVHLRLVITNVLNDIIQQLSEENCGKLLAQIQDRFTEWRVILPFACLVASRYKLERKFGRECAAHIFPAILEDKVTMELFSGVFASFIGFFDDRIAFFRRLLDEETPDARLIAFGLEAPCEFFDVTIQSPRYPVLLGVLFQRWTNPARGMLMDFLLYMVSRVPKQIAADFEDVYNAMVQRIPYVGNCRSYIAIGAEDGDVLVISKDSGQLLWKQRCFPNPIGFVSVAPKGHKFVVLSLRDKMAMWVAKERARDIFSLSGTSTYSASVIPAIGAWKGDAKVTLQTQGGQTLEELIAPKSWRLFS
jgi:hypothetical protein